MGYNLPLVAASGATASADRLVLPAAQVPPSGIVPSRHLPKFGASATPSIVLVGDSYTLNAPAMINGSDSIWGRVRRKFIEACAVLGKTPTFTNLGIGGQAWANLASGTLTTGTPLPTWWNTTQDASNGWLGAVKAAAPTTVLIHLGINDCIVGANVGALAVNVKTVLTYLQTLGCDIVLITPGTVPTFASYGDPTSPVAGVFNNGVMAVAAYLRQLAGQGGSITGIAGLPPLGLIDLHRLFVQRRYGIDPVDQYLLQTITAPTAVAYGSGGSYAFPACQGDFDLEVVWPGAASSFGSGTFSSVTMEQLTPSGANPMHILSVSSGAIEQVVYQGGVLSGVGPVGMNVPASGDLTYHLTRRGGYLWSLLNGITILEAVHPQLGAPTTPLIVVSGTAPPAMTVNSYNAGVCRQTFNDLTDALAFGDGVGPFFATQDVSFPFGGDGILHPSEYWAAGVLQPVLDATPLF